MTRATIGITDQTARPDPSYDATGGRRVHVVVIDQREAYFDSIENSTDFSKRGLDNVYYARHPRPWGIEQMIRCDDLKALKKLQLMPEPEHIKTYMKYEGKSYPSGKDHPVVTKIVTGETVAQMRQLHADRREKLAAAEDRLKQRQGHLADLSARTVAARKAARAAMASGDPAAPRLARKAQRLRLARDLKRLDTIYSERAVQARKQKLAITAGKLAARGETP
jgi:hypothetical protein